MYSSRVHRMVEEWTTVHVCDYLAGGDTRPGDGA